MHTRRARVGGSFLCFLGLKTFLSKPAEKAASTKGNGLVGSYASTFFLTITNPVTMLSFAAIFAGFGVGGAEVNYFSAAILVIEVFVSSALWWFFLSSSVTLFREKFNPHRLLWVNRISGIILTGFGLIGLISLI